MDFNEISHLLSEAIRRGVPGKLSTAKTSKKGKSRRARESAEAGSSEVFQDEVSLGEYAYKDVNWELYKEARARKEEPEDEEPSEEDTDTQGEGSQSEHQGSWEEDLDGSSSSDSTDFTDPTELAPEEISVEASSEKPQENSIPEDIEDGRAKEKSGDAPSIVTERYQPLIMEAEEFYGETLSSMLEEALREEEIQDISPEILEKVSLEPGEEDRESGITISGSETFKVKVEEVINGLPSYVRKKLSELGLRITQSEQKKFLMSEGLILYPPPATALWEFELKILLGVALDLAIGGGELSSRKSTLLRDSINAIKFRSERFPYPILSLDPAKVFSYAFAFITTSKGKFNSSKLARSSRTLYRYMVNLLRLYGQA